MLTEADVRRLADEIDYFENRARHYQAEARKAVRAPIADALIWLGLGAIGGSFAVVLSAWLIGKFVL